MSFQKGGQKRTIETGCGWRCVGHPTEVNKKFLIHKRYCKDCINNISVLPKYNRKAGLINGWNGLVGNEQTNKMITTVFVNGVRKDILVEGVSNIEDNFKDVRLLLSLTKEIKELQETPVLSKSKQKRQKQKAKKEREKEPDGTEIERDVYN